MQVGPLPDRQNLGWGDPTDDYPPHKRTPQRRSFIRGGLLLGGGRLYHIVEYHSILLEPLRRPHRPPGDRRQCPDLRRRTRVTCVSLPARASSPAGVRTSAHASTPMPRHIRIYQDVHIDKRVIIIECTCASYKHMVCFLLNPGVVETLDMRLPGRPGRPTPVRLPGPGLPGGVGRRVHQRRDGAARPGAAGRRGGGGLRPHVRANQKCTSKMPLLM